MSCFGSSRAHGDHQEHLDRAVHLLQVCLDGLQHICQIPGASLLLNTVLSLVKKVQATRANGQAIEALSEELCRLSEVLDTTMRRVQVDLQQRSGDSESRLRIDQMLREPSLLQQRVVGLQEELQRLGDLASALSQGRFLCRCLRAKRHSRVLQELNERVRQALYEFKFSGQITIEALVDEMLHKVSLVHREVVLAREDIDAVRNEIQRVRSDHQLDRDDRTLERLPQVEAGFQTSNKAAKSSYVDGTFTRILEELEVWAKGDSNSTFERLRKPVWVLSAPPGSGKSTIAAVLCRRLSSRGFDTALGASFFFNLAEAELSSARNFFPTIAYQLAHSQPALSTFIIQAAREHLKLGKNQPMEPTVKNLLLEPLKALGRSQPQRPMQPIVVVVDGIDECTGHATDTIPDMLRLLIACAQEPSSPIRILITTRPNSTINSLLDAPDLQGIVHQHHIHDRAEATTSDITAYLRTKLHGLEAIQRSTAIINKLVSHVGPSFAYAQALADFVLEHPEHLTIALSLGSAQPSPSLCALYSAITAHSSRLDSHQWKRMRGRVDRPSILDLCGAPTCYQGVTSWLRSQRAHSLAPSAQSLPDDLCAQCQTTVESAPFEAWILKRIVSCLLSSGLDAAVVLPSIPLDGHTPEDPWHPRQSATSHSRSTTALPEPLVDCEEAIQLPYPQVPVKEPAAGPAITEPLENPKIKRIPSARTVQPEESTGRAPLHEAATVRMPLAQPLEEPFVGGFVAQIQASMAAISPPPVVVPQPAPLLPDVLPLHKDTTPIPTPTAPTASRPRPPKLRIAISDPPPHTTTPIPLPYPLGVHAHETPVERRVHSPTAFRSVAPSTPRSSPRRCSPHARRGSVVLQRLGTPIQQREASPWDIRRMPNRVVAGSPVRARTGARRDLWQTDSLPSRRDSPCSPLVATSPDTRRNTA